VAVQYLGEEAYVPIESEYLELLRRVRAAPPDTVTLATLFGNWRDGSAPDPHLEADLRNTLLPLFRRLRAAEEDFASLTAPPERPQRAVLEVDEPFVAESRALGAAFEATGDALPALEAWSNSRSSIDTETRLRARDGIISALDALGESFLADLQLQGMAIHEESPRLREEAFERLIARRSESRDDDAILDLLAARAVAGGGSRITIRLVEALAEGGFDDLAFLAILGAPAAESPPEAIIGSALNLRWWTLFDAWTATLPDPRRQKWWVGLKRAATADHDGALEAFAEAGPEGREMEQRLREALRIRVELSRSDIEARRRAVLDWEAWQESHPGPWTWTDDPGLIADHAGAGACYSPARHLFIQYVRASPSRPVMATVLGPVDLRIESRPLHPEGSDGSIDGWLHVREEGFFRPFAITGNRPSLGLELVPRLGKIPGKMTASHLSLGPGLHRLQIGAPDMEVLVRVLSRRPRFPLGVLPPLTPSTLERALNGSSELPGRLASGGVRFVPSDPARDEETLPLIPIASLRAQERFSEQSGRDALLGARIALRTGEAHAAAGDTGEAGLTLAAREAMLLESESIDDAFRLPMGDRPEDIFRRMNLLVYAAESFPERRAAARVMGETLFREHPTVQGLQDLHHRLVRGMEWRLVGSIRDSAGVRRVDTIASRPESPELRTRRALLLPFAEDERLVTSESRLGLSVRNSRPTVFEIDARIDVVEFLPRSRLSVLYQLDDEAPREVGFDSESPRRTFKVLLPEGEHVFRLWMNEIVANHFLRVSLKEVVSDGAESPTALEAKPPASIERLYTVSTREKPLRLALQGPSELRVDEFRDGFTLTRHVPLLEGFHELVLPPEEGREEALLRIFQRVENPRHEEVCVARDTGAPLAVPPPGVELEARRAAPDIAVRDALGLGNEEDGTFSLETSLRRRRILEEDDRGGRNGLDADHFLEVRGSHRAFEEAWDAHFETGLLGRLHARAGPTLGIFEDIFHAPSWLPAVLRFTATAFGQWPAGGVAEPAGPFEWSISARGSVSRRFALGLRAYHTPSAALFGRVLSLRDTDRYRRGKIDQDVFTRYKGDHRAGLTLSETVGVFPWLDTELWGTASLTSNEDLNPGGPDHASLSAGLKQLWNGTQFDVTYRTTLFFHDGDRGTKRIRHALSFDARHEVWVTGRDRLEAGLEVEHEFVTSETVGFIFLAWHFGNGRGYRDFRPGQVDFGPLRSARMPPEHNNWMGEDSHE
jgi:hypothetical protein